MQRAQYIETKQSLVVEVDLTFLGEVYPLVTGVDIHEEYDIFAYGEDRFLVVFRCREKDVVGYQAYQMRRSYVPEKGYVPRPHKVADTVYTGSARPDKWDTKTLLEMAITFAQIPL